MARNGTLKIFAGSANPQLAKEITSYLNVPLSGTDIRRFPDGEIWVKLQENVRGADVFLVQPTCHPVNENLMELLLTVDACRRSSAKRITAVIPYYGYARQDRKDQPRVALTAKLVANLITTAGADRVLAMDLHAAQIQGFFDIPVDHLIAEPVLVKYFGQKKLKNLVVASTDVGGVRMARAFAEHLGAQLAIVDKRRSGPDSVEAMNLIGEVDGCDVLIPDDMISTGGTLCEAAAFLKRRGALRIFGCCTHAVFTGPALERVERAPLEEVVVTNTIPTVHIASSAKIRVLSVAPLLGEAIQSIHNETSVSRLFRVDMRSERPKSRARIPEPVK